MSRVKISRLIMNRRHKGQALIEFALLLPFLLVLILGAIEFGRLFMAQTIITNAAREGAYYLAIHPDDYNGGTGNAPNATSAAELEAFDSGLTDISVTFTPKSTDGDSFEVTVTTDVNNVPILGFIGNLFRIAFVHNGAFTLSSSVEMMVQIQ